MPAVSQLLERMRKLRAPPGPAAGVIGVPSAGDELSREVEFLFAQLDAIEERTQATIAQARAQVARIEADTDAQRRQLLADARVEAERQATEILELRRVRFEQERAAMLAEADRAAELIVKHGRERAPALVAEIVERVLEAAR